jgi:nitrogen fixation protein FixH
MAAAMQPGEGTRRGHWIPWAFVAFFGIVLAANGALIWFAFQSWTGLATGSAYQRGLAYNRTLEAAKQQAALGWKVGFSFEQTGERQAMIELTLEDRHGDLLESAKVEATIVRPTHAGYDFVQTLAHRTAGRYQALLDLPLPGQWEIRIVAAEGGDAYRLTERVYLRP